MFFNNYFKNKYLEKSLKSYINISVKKLEALEQDKVYYVVLGEDVSYKEAESFKQSLEILRHSLNWTCPRIILINKELKELNVQELKELLKEMEVKDDS